jgi:hypothetical protein
VTWAGSREERHRLQEEMGRSDELNREAWKTSFSNLFKALSSKIKDSNTFKSKFELRPN